MNPIRKYIKDLFAAGRVLDRESDLKGLSRADALLCDLVNDQRVPGLAISVLKEGEMLFQKGYGYADIEQKIPVDPTKTIFRIASVSKPIAATALAYAVADGLIDLDASLYDYVPYFPKKRWDFTIRQLAGHTAGIRGYRGVEYGLDKPLTIEEGTTIFKDDALQFEPGTDYLYTSYDWVLISLAIEEASESSFEKYVQKKVLTPLNMNNTFAERYSPTESYSDRPETLNTPPLSAARNEPQDETFLHEGLNPLLTTFYSKNRKGFRLAKSVNNAYKLAGGGYLSTSEDIAKFGQAHLDAMASGVNARDETNYEENTSEVGPNNINAFDKATTEGLTLDRSILESFLTSQKINGEPTYYGLGWQVSQDASGRNYYGHVGNGVGGYSNFHVFPEQQMVFSILINCTDPKVQVELDAIREVFFKRPTGESKT